MNIRALKKHQFKSFLISHINQILFSFYLGTVWNIHIYTLIGPQLQNISIPKYVFLFLAIIPYILAWFVSIIIFKYITKITTRPSETLTKKKKISIFSLTFMGALIICLIWFFAYNPGSFSPDSIDQLTQASSGNYLDWHPALHTILVFTIPYSIFNSPAAIILVQIVFFASVLAYSILAIYEIAGKKWSIFTFIVIMFNPIVVDNLMFPWKDVTFAIFALLLTAISLRIYYSNGTWGNNTWKLIILSIVIAITSILRHNGILFTAPLIVFLFFFLNHKQWLKLFACFILAFFIIKVPIYSAFDVKSPNRGAEETLGLPLTMLANVAKTTPEVMDESTSNLMYSIATQEQWQNLYTTGDFNSIKWSGINLAPVSEFGAAKILGLTAKNFIASPNASAIALFKSTQVVYGMEGTFFHETPTTAENPLGYAGNQTLAQIIAAYRKIFNESITKYLGYTGVTIIAILAFVLGRNSWRRKNWKKILLCTPILFYDFGTMLLLTGPEARFFFLNLIIYPIIIILAITKPKISSSSSSKTKSQKQSN